jgi:putative sterol carrier protein
MPSASEVILEMPDHFDPVKAGDMNVAVQFALSGDGGGNWYVRIADGKCEVRAGILDEPQATIKMAADDYVKMTAGELNAMVAFISGRIKVVGNLSTVMRMQSLFGV